MFPRNQEPRPFGEHAELGGEEPGTCKLNRVDKERGLLAWQELSVPTETVLAPVGTQQLQARPSEDTGLALRNISQEFS